MENQRRAERLSTLCMGYCHVENEPLDMWRECEIIDVSTLGLGIEFSYPDPVELLGLWQDGELRLHMSRRISVRLDLGPSLDMTVVGEVRNAGSGPDGSVRAGVEFVSLTEPERSIVDHLVEALSPHQTMADPVAVLSEVPESLVEVRGRHQAEPDPVSVLGDLPESLVEALGQREIVDPAPVLDDDLPPRLVEALGQREIVDPAPVLDDDLPPRLVEALGRREIGDPAAVFDGLPESFSEVLDQEEIGVSAPMLGDLPESFVDALDQQVISSDPVPEIDALRERFVQFLDQEEIGDPAPVLDDLPLRLVETLDEEEEEIGDPVSAPCEPSESLLEALGRQQEIVDPAPVFSELPGILVEPRGQRQTVSGPVPGLGDLARKGGELAFLTVRVIGSDVLDLVGRLPVAPRILHVTGLHARLGFGDQACGQAADESGDV